MKRRKAVVLLSGGADSTTILFQAMAECHNVHAISVYYGQRHKKELECAKAICDAYNIPHTVIDFSALGSLGGSPLVDTNIDVPPQKTAQQSTTVVPYRNTFLATIAAAYAHKHQLNTIYMGPTWEDLENYPDCRPEYFNVLQKTLRLGGVLHDLELCVPFVETRKQDIVRVGTRLGVPYELTWTCYKGNERPCLECDACVERMDSFHDNEIKDPLVTDEEWDNYIKNRKQRNLEIVDTIRIK